MLAVGRLSWTRPELWPWLLLAVPVWGLAWWWLRRRQVARSAYGAVFTERASAPWLRALRLSGVLICLFLVYMEPRYGEEKVQVERRGLDVVFALDTSRSMLARDMDPSRLDAAKRDILSVLPELVGGDRVGLVAFAGQARLIVPLTHDLDSFRQLLGTVDTATVRKGGTDLATALRKCLKLVDEGQQTTSVIVLLTDGEDLSGAGKQAAREAKSRGVVVHAVGYGSVQGSKIVLDKSGNQQFLKNNAGGEVVTRLDSDGLRALAEVTGGEFLPERRDDAADPPTQDQTVGSDGQARVRSRGGDDLQDPLPVGPASGDAVVAPGNLHARRCSTMILAHSPAAVRVGHGLHRWLRGCCFRGWSQRMGRDRSMGKGSRALPRR